MKNNKSPSFTLNECMNCILSVEYARTLLFLCVKLRFSNSRNYIASLKTLDFLQIVIFIRYTQSVKFAKKNARVISMFVLGYRSLLFVFLPKKQHVTLTYLKNIKSALKLNTR